MVRRLCSVPWPNIGCALVTVNTPYIRAHNTRVGNLVQPQCLTDEIRVAENRDIIVVWIDSFGLLEP